MSAPAKTFTLLDWTAAAARRDEAGGKGWQLGMLARYGLPVPDGFVVPASASGASVMPPGLAATLGAELERRGWLDTPLAVRSSANVEDSERASFAGIHRSLLNVRGAAALAEAVQAVWASLWTPQAAAYRERFGIADADAAMAVVVMPMLPAQAAGIAFSCDPRNGRDDQIVLHAHWGLGEALVAGETDGDEYRLQEDPLDTRLSLIKTRIGSKSRMTVAREEGGTALVVTPADEAARAVLTPDQALMLGEMVRDAAFALDFARPFYDIEWVWDGSRFWLVQARPVTAMARNTYPALASQPAIWSTGNTRDIMPLPMSAADWCHVRRYVNELLEAAYRDAGYPLLPGGQRAAMFHGRLYLELSMLMWEAWDGFGVAPKVINEMAGGHQPEITVPPVRLRDRLRRLRYLFRFLRNTLPIRRHADRHAADARALASQWKSTPLPDDPAACHDRMRECARAIRGHHALGLMQASSGAALTMLTEKLAAYLPDRAYTVGSALLAGGEPSVTAQQGYALMALAEVASAHHEVRDWLRNPRRDDDGWRRLPAEHPFRLGFAAFLAQYGHRTVYESYLRHARWHEEPGYLLDNIAGLIGSSIAEVRQRQEHARQEAWREVRKAMPWHARIALKQILAMAARDSNQRELARSTFAVMGDALRPLILRLGELLAARGAMRRPEHVFELTLAEAGLAARGMTPPAGIAARVADRLAQRAQWEKVEAPHVILTGTAGAAPVQARERSPSGGEVRTGVAVGAGIARGIARIIRDPHDGKRLARGEILVAPSTDPAWTPLFLKAAGLIMETGGYLSHGAIVAREFAIPAVVNLPGILCEIRDGDLVEVDGGRGEVRVLSAVASRHCA